MNQDETLANSMGDFITLLVREISQSLALAKYEAPLVQVHKIRVRFGQEEDSESIITDRYPFLAKGWDIEMEMDGRLHARLHGEVLPSFPLKTTLADRFGSNPLSDIKGVSRDWANFFNTHQIRSIGDLAGISMAGLQDLAREKSNITLWEIHGKVRLLNCDIPFFPPSPLDGNNLYTLLKMEPQILREQAGIRAVTMDEIQRLLDILELLAIIIDARVLKNTSLSTLLTQVAPAG